MNNFSDRVSPPSLITSLILAFSLCPGLGEAQPQRSYGNAGGGSWELGRILELGAGQDGVGPRGDDEGDEDGGEGEGGRVLELGAGENGRVLELGAGEDGRVLELGAGEDGLAEGLWSWLLGVCGS